MCYRLEFVVFCLGNTSFIFGCLVSHEGRNYSILDALSSDVDGIGST